MLVLVPVLGGVGYLGYLVYDRLSPGRAGAAPAWSEQDERVVTAVRARRRVPAAQLPWLVDARDPEEVRVGGAALPWRERPGPDGVTVAAAGLPARFPERVAADEPRAARVGEAGLPWVSRAIGAHPVKVALAAMPAIKRALDP